MTRFPWLLPLILVGSGCASSNASDSSSAAVADTAAAEDEAKADEAERVELSLGESGSAAGLVIRFVRVVGDSRCPVGVDCVWAGDAEVEIEINAEQTRTLHTNLEPKATEVDAVAVVLVDLLPYPHIDVSTDPADVVLVLDVGGPAPSPESGNLSEARSSAPR